MSGRYVYRLDVTKPEGSDAPGWQPDGWEDICEALEWYSPSFQWPRRRNYLTIDGANTRAALLRRLGATVEIVVGTVTWPQLSARPFNPGGALMCQVDWAEPFEFYLHKMVNARKPHTCDECRSTIAVGERYRFAVGLFEGDWASYHICSWCIDGPCAWLMEECGGWCHQGVQEDLEEHWGELFGRPSEERLALGRLIIGMRWRSGQRKAQR